LASGNGYGQLDVEENCPTKAAMTSTAVTETNLGIGPL
jgi:hypothetical protein